MAKVAPGRASGRISKPRLAALVDAIRTVLVSAIEAGGSSLRDYVRPTGDLGYFSSQWRVSGREGEVCLCGAPIRRTTERSEEPPSEHPSLMRRPAAGFCM